MALTLTFEKVIVKDNITRIIKAESEILQLATMIQSTVTQEQYNALDDKVTLNQSTITQTATDFTAKINNGTHVLNESGYTFKDSKGDILLTSNGVANEQNIGRADNVEDGYPMRLPFNIGTEVSQIVQAKLKWDISPFRTYSKGAASGGGIRTTPSGGGSTSGASSKSTTDAVWSGSSIAESTSAVTAGSLPHQHTILKSKLSHGHGMNHYHSTPAHSHTLDITHDHAPQFGILTTPVSSNWVAIYIDGTYRTAIDAQRGEVDLSAWITTNGWHTIELVATSMKRIDASLFLKTYIRR